MPSAKYTAIAYVAGADVLAANHSTDKDDTQTEFETRMNAIVQPFVSSGFTTSINVIAVDVASGEAYDGNGKRYNAAGSVSFSGADANGAWKIYIRASDETYQKTQGALAAADVYLADVTWTNPTLSGLTDKRVTKAVHVNNVQILDQANTWTAAQTFSANDNRFTAAPAATANRGVVNIGSGGFDGGANHYVGVAAGTLLALNAESGFTGNLIDLQRGGTSRFKQDYLGGTTLFANTATVSGITLNISDANTTNGMVFAFGYRGGLLNEKYKAVFIDSNGLNFGKIVDALNALPTAQLLVTHAGAVGIGTTTPVVGGGLTIAPAARTNVSPSLLTIIGPADTALTALVEAVDMNVNLARTVQFNAGALATQRAVRFQAPTYSFVAASTITDAATIHVDRAPQAGLNATITNPYALWIDDGRVRIDQEVALGGGAAPTLGTIGGSGPTAAAQAAWLEITTQNGKSWVPIWR